MGADKLQQAMSDTLANEEAGPLFDQVRACMRTLLRALQGLMPGVAWAGAQVLACRAHCLVCTPAQLSWPVRASAQLCSGACPACVHAPQLRVSFCPWEG